MATTLTHTSPPLSKKSKNIKNGKYSYKNLPKIIGNSINATIKTGYFLKKNIFSELAKKTGIDGREFSNWAKKNEKMTRPANLEEFRNLFKGKIDYLLGSQDQKCKYVLRNLIIWFLENEIYHCFIFLKTFRNVDRSVYLKRIPKFLAGLYNHEGFFNLK